MSINQTSSGLLDPALDQSLEEKRLERDIKLLAQLPLGRD